MIILLVDDKMYNSTQIMENCSHNKFIFFYIIYCCENVDFHFISQQEESIKLFLYNNILSNNAI